MVFEHLLKVLSEAFDFHIKNSDDKTDPKVLDFLKRCLFLISQLFSKFKSVSSHSLADLAILASGSRTVRLIFEILLQNKQFQSLLTLRKKVVPLLNVRHHFNINLKSVEFGALYFQILKVKFAFLVDSYIGNGSIIDIILLISQSQILDSSYFHFGVPMSVEHLHFIWFEITV